MWLTISGFYLEKYMSLNVNPRFGIFTNQPFAAGDSTLYFSRGDPYNPNQIPDTALTTYDIWQVEVTPVVDLNIDGIVDSADICILVDNWYTKNTVCDIAPAPLGDGYVDVQDLIVLVEHLFEEFPPAEPAE